MPLPLHSRHQRHHLGRRQTLSRLRHLRYLRRHHTRRPCRLTPPSTCLRRCNQWTCTTHECLGCRAPICFSPLTPTGARQATQSMRLPPSMQVLTTTPPSPARAGHPGPTPAPPPAPHPTPSRRHRRRPRLHYPRGHRRCRPRRLRCSLLSLGRPSHRRGGRLMAKATSRCHSHRRRPRRSGRISRRNIRSTYGFARHNFLLGHFLLGAVGAALACIGVLSMGSHRAPFGAQVGAQVSLLT